MILPPPHTHTHTPSKTHTPTHTHMPDPPSIIYTTEYTIASENDFGTVGQLMCTVQTSPDTSSSVTWYTKGSEIVNSTKYTSIAVTSDEDDIVRYQLIVSDVQKTDIGSYLCRLSSSYGVEDVQETWIQVDFRKSE